MHSLNLFRKLRGYVEFKIPAGNYSKVLSDSLTQKLCLWDSKIDDEYIFTSKAYTADYKQILEVADKNNIEIIKLKERGLIPKILKVKGIYSIVLGLIISFFIISMLSQFVWKIEVIGEENFDSSNILKIAEDSGIRIGAHGKDLDLRYIEQVIMSKADNLSWVGISRKGVAVYIDVRERIMPPKLTYKDEPCNLRAFYDGRIVNARTYKGSQIINEGCVVKKGDLLVSGAYQPGDESVDNIYTHATADIIAECPLKKTFYLPLITSQNVRTDEIIKRRFIKFFNMDIPLFLSKKINGEYICEETSNNIEIFDTTLPIDIVEKKYTKTKKQIVDYTDIAVQTMDKMISNYETEISDNMIIISKNENRLEKNGIYVSEIDYVLQMDIGYEEIIFVKQ